MPVGTIYPRSQVSIMTVPNELGLISVRKLLLTTLMGRQAASHS